MLWKTKPYRNIFSSAKQNLNVQAQPVGREILDLLQKHFVDDNLLHRWMESGAAYALLENHGPDNATYDSLVNAALAKLPISHTRRFTPDGVEYFHVLDTYASAGLGKRLKALFPTGIQYTGVGILTQLVEGKYFVAAALPNGPAALAGIKRGDELLAVNERPFSPVKVFVGLDKQVVSLLRRNVRELAPESVPVLPRILAPRRLLRQASIAGARILSGARRSIAYYKPWSLAGDSHWRALVSTVTGRLGDADALILDLRNTIGGASPHYAEFFIGRSPELCLSCPGRATTVVNRHWRKPVVILVDETTRSGNEVLAFSLQRAGCPLIGRRTAGEVAAAAPFLLGDGSLLLVATKQVIVDGEVLEGRGVTPDIEVASPLAFAQGADLQLDAAVTCVNA